MKKVKEICSSYYFWINFALFLVLTSNAFATDALMIEADDLTFNKQDAMIIGGAAVAANASIWAIRKAIKTSNRC